MLTKTKTKISLFIALSFWATTTNAAEDTISDLLNNTPVVTDSYQAGSANKAVDTVAKDIANTKAEVITESEYPVLPKTMETETSKGMVVNAKKTEQLSKIDVDTQKNNNVSYEKSISFLNLLSDLTTSFSTGNNQQTFNNTVYVFFDPQCPHCGELWNAAQNEVFKEKRFVWIPVSFMNELSPKQSATILMSQDPVKSMNSHEISLKNGYKGLTSFDNIPENINNRIKVNGLFFSKLNSQSVPVVLHMTKKGEIDAKEGSMTVEELKLYISK